MEKLSLSLFFRNLNNLNLRQQLKHNSICPQLKLSNLIKMVIHQIKHNNLYVWTLEKDVSVGIQPKPCVSQLNKSLFGAEVELSLCAHYLAASYCLILIMVSSIVLSTSVFTLEMKKLMAASSVSPFLDNSFWVSALYPNSSWKEQAQLFVFIAPN